MPVNTELANKIWLRYAYCRDNGHTKFVEKADKCDRFFVGDQWDPTDRALLESNRRPVLYFLIHLYHRTGIQFDKSHMFRQMLRF